MRVQIELRPGDECPQGTVIPLQYNRLVQAALYRNLKPALSEWLHDYGYVIEGRGFKLFTFSRLFGSFRRQDDGLVFTGPIRFYVASPVPEFILSLTHSLVRAGHVRIGSSELEVAAINVLEAARVADRLVVQTLSPITTYSTLTGKDGSKKTYYFSPFESEFSAQIGANIRKKYALVNGAPAPSDWSLNVKPVGVKSNNQVILTYKGTVIKGWTGRYVLEGHPKLIALGLEAGLGAKTPQGFGMVQAVDDRVRLTQGVGRC